jgi:hypothetical protein
VSGAFKAADFTSDDAAAWTSQALKEELGRGIETMVQQAMFGRKVSATFRLISKALAVSRSSSLVDLQAAVKSDGSG